MEYVVRRTNEKPELTGDWNGAVWRKADITEIAEFRPEGSDHRPRTQVRMLYDDENIYTIFRVEDNYVRSVHTDYCGLVCTDSCVEVYLHPRADKGYFNFEFNCGGVLNVSYIEDHERTPDGFKKFMKLPADHGHMVSVYHSMPEVVDPEIQEPTTWILECAIPVKLIEEYVGALGDVNGQSWKGNFYKCGDDTSHPHWGAWSPVTAVNFHLPDCYGTFRFEGS